MIAAKNNEAALNVYNKTVQSMKSNGLDFVVSFMADGYQASKKALGVEVGWPAYQEGYTAPTTGANGDFSYYKYKN